MEKQRYITRYEAEKGSSYTFRGWRLCITRQGERFVRYFSDLKCGGADNGLALAMEMRDKLLDALEASPGMEEAVFGQFRRCGNKGNMCQEDTKNA